jgi:hypothetical protein
VTPAERLRSVTRRGVEEYALASEAAGALVSFASEPASLVVACRRLLAHHRAHGPLWWTCARILAAADPIAAARDAMKLLDADRTAERLAASIPLLDDGEVVAIVGWPHPADLALAERADVEAVAVRIDGADPMPSLRHRIAERTIRVVDQWSPQLSAATHLIVPARAIGHDEVLAPAGTGALLDELARHVGEVWLLGGVGRVLPARLFAAAATAVDAGRAAEYGVDDDDESELVPLARFDRVAGPRGIVSLADAVEYPDCPVVPELLRPLE